MIGLDNGPAHGDYVRYIETLLARRAAALVASDGAMPTFVDASRVAPQAAWPASARATSNPSPRPSAGQVGGVGSTSMLPHGPLATGGPSIELIGVGIGAALVVAGLFAPAFGVFFVLAGAGLVYAMLKRLFTKRAAPLQDRA